MSALAQAEVSTLTRLRGRSCHTCQTPRLGAAGLPHVVRVGKEPRQASRWEGAAFENPWAPEESGLGGLA